MVAVKAMARVRDTRRNTVSFVLSLATRPLSQSVLDRSLVARRLALKSDICCRLLINFPTPLDSTPTVWGISITSEM